MCNFQPPGKLVILNNDYIKAYIIAQYVNIIRPIIASKFMVTANFNIASLHRPIYFVT